MRKIYKYPFEIDVRLGIQTVELKVPDNATILKIEAQRDVPTIWCLVTPEAPETVVKLHVLGTGREVPDNYWPVGSFQMHGGDLVWHCFIELDQHMVEALTSDPNEQKTLQ